MIKDFLEIGQVVSTHGIHGEIRLNPWCDSPQFLNKFKTLYFDEKGTEPVEVIKARPHGNISVVKLQGVDTVEDAAALRNKILYFKRSDAVLPDGQWFISELLGCAVLDVDDNSVCYGVLKDVESTGANDIWFIETPEKKEVIIPAVKEVVIRCEPENDKVYIRPLRGLFDGED